jgi:hypothetical protein
MDITNFGKVLIISLIMNLAYIARIMKNKYTNLKKNLKISRRKKI